MLKCGLNFFLHSGPHLQLTISTGLQPIMFQIICLHLQPAVRMGLLPTKVKILSVHLCLKTWAQEDRKSIFDHIDLVMDLR